MARTTKLMAYKCLECGSLHSKWMGKCSECGAWNSVQENQSATGAGKSSKLVRFQDIEAGQALQRESIEIDFLNRVLGGGLPRVAATLLAGEPGIGKSTLLFQLFAKTKKTALYVSAEESIEQVAARFQSHQAETQDQSSQQLYILAESRLSEIVSQIQQLKPEIVAIDSIQMILADSGLERSRGFAGSIRETAEALISLSKSQGFQLWVVGHITKDGEIAGPKLLEHLVDTVLTFSNSDEPGARILQVQKHRFGASGEIALLEMSEKGLAERSDGDGFWMSKRDHESPGCAFAPVVFGSRVYCVELQALVTPTFFPSPRRSSSGFDLNRLHLLCAVIEKHLGVSLSKYDVYLNVVGGIRLQDPATDLACAAAIVSSLTERAIPIDIAFSGEVGLTGEIRLTPMLRERSKLLERIGKKMLMAAPHPEKIPGGLRVRACRHLRDALGSLLESQKS